jgi:antitoxin (DNA-binding transcriptional repressor) of toxin-antitoxin stability system
METLYFLLYWVVVVALVMYGASLLIALIASLAVVIKAEAWEVDPKDPLNKEKLKKVIRKVEPFEILIITKGGKPVFPIIDMNEKRLTVEGLRDSQEGIDNEKPGQWKVIELGKDDPYPQIIQSKWGWLSPCLYSGSWFSM